MLDETLFDLTISGPVICVACSDDGNKIIVGDRNGNLTLLNKNGQIIWEKNIDEGVHGLAIIGNGNKVICGGKDCKLRMFSSMGIIEWEQTIGKSIWSLSADPNGQFITIGTGELNGQLVNIGVMDFSYMGGSMGSVVGEKITRMVEKAIENKGPVLLFTASGGARMQEGILSLMQMAKTSAALQKLSKAAVPYISIVCDPTTGGTSASFAMLGDINLAEPGALISFAGARVIEQTIRQKLPKGFQRAEFLLEHGMLDDVVPRSELRETLSKLVYLMNPHSTSIEITKKGS